MDIVKEIYQLLFISSIIFNLNILVDIGLKMYGRFILKNETIKIKYSNAKKIVWWITLTIIFGYIF